MAGGVDVSYTGLPRDMQQLERLLERVVLAAFDSEAQVHKPGVGQAADDAGDSGDEEVRRRACVWSGP